MQDWGWSVMTVAIGSRQHRAGELAADRIIHIMGTLAGVVASAILVCIAALTADRRVFYASLVYSVCLLMMLACSAAYNLSNASRRGRLRQIDHAIIFLMIAVPTPHSRRADCTVFGRSV